MPFLPSRPQPGKLSPQKTPHSALIHTHSTPQGRGEDRVSGTRPVLSPRIFLTKEE